MVRYIESFKDVTGSQHQHPSIYGFSALLTVYSFSLIGLLSLPIQFYSDHWLFILLPGPPHPALPLIVAPRSPALPWVLRHCPLPLRHRPLALKLQFRASAFSAHPTTAPT